MGTKQKVLTIKDSINKLEKELEQLQNNCSHNKKSTIKFINLNTGVRWVCDECQTLTRIPNQKELTEWIVKKN
tara:strand:+ start:319 stop:537 length:219 start_codon:yes stop_codon:yes gene_type:complete